MLWIWFVPQRFMCWKLGPQYSCAEVAEVLRGGAQQKVIKSWHSTFMNGLMLSLRSGNRSSGTSLIPMNSESDISRCPIFTCLLPLVLLCHLVVQSGGIPLSQTSARLFGPSRHQKVEPNKPLFFMNFSLFYYSNTKQTKTIVYLESGNQIFFSRFQNCV